MTMSLKIGVIVGSTRPTRAGRQVADWFMDEVKNTPDVEFVLLDLKEIDLPFLNEPGLPAQADYKNESTKKWSDMVEPLDGFVLVTPEYNHAVAAPLKNALDILYNEWNRKPVAFVGYGALGAARAIEQLVGAVTALGMAPLNSSGKTINIVEIWAAFDEDGQLKPDHIKSGNPEKVVDNLVWWANALKAARK